jgi:F-type H+-transporting ATPase subunit delta
LPKTKKVQIVEKVLERSSYGEKVLRYILLLVENGRIELLAEILESFPIMWNEQRGVHTFEVASVVPLTNSQKELLEKKLELLEKAPVILKYRIDPELIGGLWIRKGNIVYDVSIKGSLMKLKEQIMKGR